jgi:L-ascorbate metabolism protein UlaG (beta-lactamase superfamily)
LKIKYLGHAAFILASDDGRKILTDPYESGCYGGALRYGPISEKVDVVTASHEHEDHFCLDGLPGGFEVIKTPGSHSAAGFTISGTKAYHDDSGGKERGRNIIFTFDIDGIRVTHLGDLGHGLSGEEAASIGKVDVLLVPVGGHFTIGPKEALGVIKALDPAVVIPMHYKTDVLDFPIAPVEDFLSLAGAHERAGASEIEINKDDLGSRRIIVLEHEL